MCTIAWLEYQSDTALRFGAEYQIQAGHDGRHPFTLIVKFPRVPTFSSENHKVKIAFQVNKSEPHGPALECHFKETSNDKSCPWDMEKAKVGLDVGFANHSVEFNEARGIKPLGPNPRILQLEKGFLRISITYKFCSKEDVPQGRGIQEDLSRLFG